MIIQITDDEHLKLLEIAEEIFQKEPAEAESEAEAEADLLLLRIVARANNTYRQRILSTTRTELDDLLMGISQHDPNGNSTWVLINGSLKRRE